MCSSKFAVSNSLTNFLSIVPDFSGDNFLQNLHYQGNYHRLALPIHGLTYNKPWDLSQVSQEAEKHWDSLVVHHACYQAWPVDAPHAPDCSSHQM